MLRFISHNLTSIDGIALFPILSLLVFTVFFALMFWYVIKLSKNKVEELSNIPLELDNNDINNTKNENKH
jgi:Fe2+ transport system protein B